MRHTHQTISTLTDQVLQAAAQFRQRPLPEELALVYLDGLLLKVLGEEGVERAAVYVALGVTPAGGRCGRTPSGRAKPVHQAGLLALAQRER